MVGYFYNFLMIGGFILNVADRIFPTWVEDCVLNISFKFIYVYSNIQLLMFKIKDKWDKYMNYDNDNEDNDVCAIQTYKNGLLCDVRYYFSKPEKGVLNTIDKDDFIINSIVIKGCRLNKIVQHDMANNNFVFEETTYSFIMIEFKIGEKGYKIDLKTDKYNYYMVDNLLNKYFFIHYIKYHLSDLTKDVDQYQCSIKLIDADVNVIEFDFTDKNESIILRKEGYRV
jgi:hypothetical protein